MFILSNPKNSRSSFPDERIDFIIFGTDSGGNLFFYVLGLSKYENIHVLSTVAKQLSKSCEFCWKTANNSWNTFDDFVLGNLL